MGPFSLGIISFVIYPEHDPIPWEKSSDCMLPLSIFG